MFTEQVSNSVLAVCGAIIFAVFAWVVLGAPLEVSLGLFAGSLVAITITAREMGVWHPWVIVVVITAIMVVVFGATSIVGSDFPVAPSFYWGMLGLFIGWVWGLAMSWPKPKDVS